MLTGISMDAEIEAVLLLKGQLAHNWNSTATSLEAQETFSNPLNHSEVSQRRIIPPSANIMEARDSHDV